MNGIWGGMLLAGIVYGVLTGEVQAVSDAFFSSAKEAITLCVTMFGVMAFWSGLMEIAKDAGLIEAIVRRLRPVMRFLFPDIPENHPALTHITANCVANLLGLGGAATVYGLHAIAALEELEEERRASARLPGTRADPDVGYGNRRQPKGRAHPIVQRPVPCGTANNEMCNFLILNISSLQLIPMSVIAWRGQYGSVNPTAIVGPGIVATAVSTGAAVVFCRRMNRRSMFKSDNRSGRPAHPESDV
ncbi:MAG: nucleoside recognition protein [Lachnospiraceae bacterium]|nr:nucleoside recognition protein [Lachnospiraceae bacterium]